MAKLGDIANLFDQLNASGEVHSKVNELPCNTFSCIFFLLQHEHVVIEKLLQFLISKVNAKLLEAVILQKLNISTLIGVGDEKITW